MEEKENNGKWSLTFPRHKMKRNHKVKQRNDYPVSKNPNKNLRNQPKIFYMIKNLTRKYKK